MLLMEFVLLFLYALLISTSEYSSSSTYTERGKRKPILKKPIVNSKDEYYNTYGRDDHKYDFRQNPVRRPYESNYRVDEYSSEEIYEEKDHKPTSSDERPQQTETVRAYTGSVASALVVAASSAVSAAILLSILAKMATSSTPPPALLLAAAGVVLVANFLPGGDFSDFARSLGVLSLLLVQRGKLGKFAAQLAQMSLSAGNLASRRPYPPSDNPWKYVPPEQGSDQAPVQSPALAFSMVSALAAAGLLGAAAGWSVSGRIPLVGGWLGALLGGGAVTYLGSQRDARGDLVRFVGNSVACGVTELRQAADDVNIGSNAGRLWGRASGWALAMDRQYGLLDKARSLFGWGVGLAANTVNKVRRDMADDEDAGRDTGRGSYQAGPEEYAGRPGEYGEADWEQQGRGRGW